MNRRMVVVVVIVVILLVGSVAVAQNDEFKIPWHRVAGGGGTSVDGDRFGISGTMGQAEAGILSDGASFVVRGGYWYTAAPGPADEDVFLPLVVRSE